MLWMANERRRDNACILRCMAQGVCVKFSLFSTKSASDQKSFMPEWRNFMRELCYVNYNHRKRAWITGLSAMGKTWKSAGTLAALGGGYVEKAVESVDNSW